MSQEIIYLDIFERLIYNPYAKRIEINMINDMPIEEISEYYEEQLESALGRLKYDRAIKRYRIYGSKLYLYLN